MQQLKKDITFIYMDTSEYQNYYPIYEEALRRGYHARFSKNKFEKCEIGVYCQHQNYPRFSRFSIIMLHDITQAYARWPDIWFVEPWNKYNVGVLPGNNWAAMWKRSSKYFYCRPKQGVYKIGWPKADILNSVNTGERRNSLIQKYKLDPNKKTVLYAPAWENDNKQNDFVMAMKTLDVNILIKQAPWDKELFPEIIANIEKVNSLHRNMPGVVILDPKVNILHAILMSDILVSEESSTMCEAVMMGIPAVSVSDWLIPDCKPKRYPEDNYDFVVKTTKGKLANCIEHMVENYDIYKKEAELYSIKNFGGMGNCADRIMNIIDAVIENREIPEKSLDCANRQRLPLKIWINFYLTQLKFELANNYSVRYGWLRHLKKGYKKLRGIT